MLDFLFEDAWAPIMQRFNMDQRNKLRGFLILTILLSIILEIFIQGGFENISENINSYSLVISTLLWLMGIMLNSKRFHSIKNVAVWEVIIGVIVIIFAFTIVTPIKHIYFPETRNFGVLNGGIVIFGFFVVFYGIKKYKVIFPFGILYGIFIVLNLLWNVLGNSFLGYNLAIFSSNAAYEILKFMGYAVSLNGTTISIVTANGEIVSATVSGLCSGVEGITFSAVVLVLLYMGSYINYKWRTLTILIATIIMLFLNILRIVLIFISAYYYGQLGLEEAHAWLGNIIFLSFILPYWYLIDVKLNKPRELNTNENETP